ncbi:MAG: acetyl esterase [Chloroflexota bacterium]|jgi:acetyl esterase/lipase|nr:acetyl esterase [Chloroflexota bacterium]
MTATQALSQYVVRVSDVACERAGSAPLRARVYQPDGVGPFPIVLNVHGGTWFYGSRPDGDCVFGNQDAMLDQALAASGIIVAALATRLAPQHPYPAPVEDVQFAARWFAANAARFNGASQRIGGFGCSSGANALLLSAMRPWDALYDDFPSRDITAFDGRIDYVIAAAPSLDPRVQYEDARAKGRTELLCRMFAFFQSQRTLDDANPQLMLDRGRPVLLPPVLLLHSTVEPDAPMEVAQRFVAAYRAAGGPVQFETFPETAHRFIHKPGPASERAAQLMRAFVAQQLSSTAGAVVAASGRR